MVWVQTLLFTNLPSPIDFYSNSFLFPAFRCSLSCRILKANTSTPLNTQRWETSESWWLFCFFVSTFPLFLCHLTIFQFTSLYSHSKVMWDRGESKLFLCKSCLLFQNCRLSLLIYSTKILWATGPAGVSVFVSLVPEQELERSRKVEMTYYATTDNKRYLSSDLAVHTGLGKLVSRPLGSSDVSRQSHLRVDEYLWHVQDIGPHSRILYRERKVRKDAQLHERNRPRTHRPVHYFQGESGWFELELIRYQQSTDSDPRGNEKYDFRK